MKREVLPEILDDLDPADPRAVRSRRDLRMVNQLMRGEAWIMRQVREVIQKDTSVKQVIELGAGEGLLSVAIKKQFPYLNVVALDLVERPAGLPCEVDWVVSDVLKYDGYEEGSIVVANLFIHHLQNEQLRELGEKMKFVSAMLFAEPHRRTLSLAMGYCIFPLVNEVTRHDMIVSVRAGFMPDNLPNLLGGSFEWEESFGLIGGIRVKGLKR